jgi:hypothetical protein
VAGAIVELQQRDLIDTKSGTRIELTDEGCTAFTKLARAVREHLMELAADWNPQQDPDITEYLRAVVHDAVPDRGRR